jgi:phosphorylase kinase alpha/beta subunit
LLRQCRGLLIGDQMDSRNRLESALAQADMTSGERNFELQVEDLLNKIQAPEYRQLCIEAMVALSHMQRANWGLRLDSYLVLDVIIGHGVRQSWRELHPEIGDELYNEHVADAWVAFYASPPHRVANCILAAVRYLLDAAAHGSPEKAEAAAP